MQSNSREPYSIGIATGDITPPVGLPLAGFSAPGAHSSTGVYHPLRTIATAIDDGDTATLIISAEWLGFYNLTNRIRKSITETTGLPEAQIILAATHTHCGPAFREDHILSSGETDPDYLDKAVATITGTAHRAWKYRCPARLFFGTARRSFGINRRFPDLDNPGRIQRKMAPNPDGFANHTVSVLAIESQQTIRSILFSYACHPTSRGGLLFGGDYVGFAYDEIQDTLFNVQPAFMQGCCGDIRPKPSTPDGKDFYPLTLAETQERGRELGAAVVDLIQNGKLDPITGPIAIQQNFLPLQTEPVDQQAMQEALLNPDASPGQKRWADYHKNRFDKGLPEEREVPLEIQTIRFGSSLAIPCLSGEMTIEHALRLKHELQPYFSHVFPVAYTNDNIGYVPVKRQFTELGYEVVDSNQLFLRTGRYLPETEDQIHATIHSMLDIPKN
ncbi:MAG: neutral/alkaline non-lysosomal ceramidase N-terminal domain-containing protein [Chthoniobacterales bacterium]